MEVVVKNVLRREWLVELGIDEILDEGRSKMFLFGFVIWRFLERLVRVV